MKSAHPFHLRPWPLGTPPVAWGYCEHGTGENEALFCVEFEVGRDEVENDNAMEPADCEAA